MRFPVHDWQFWVTTGVVAAAGFFLLRRFWPSRLVPKPLRGVLGRPSGRRTTLTIEGRAAEAGKGSGGAGPGREG